VWPEKATSFHEISISGRLQAAAAKLTDEDKGHTPSLTDFAIQVNTCFFLKVLFDNKNCSVKQLFDTTAFNCVQLNIYNGRLPKGTQKSLIKSCNYTHPQIVPNLI